MRASRSRLVGRSTALGALALVVAALVSACGSKPAPSSTAAGLTAPPAPTSTAAPGTPGTMATATASASPSASVAAATATEASRPTPAGPTPIVGEETVTKRGADGSWTFSFRRPVVSGTLSIAAARMNDRIAALVALYASRFEGDLPPPGSGTSTFAGTFSVAYLSPALLSIRFAADRSISVAAHPDHIVGSLTFAVSTGEVIALTGLFRDPAAGLRILSAESRAMLRAQLPADEQEQLAAGTEPVASSFDAAWAITNDGLEITFPEYAVGPYAVGTPVVVVPWSALEPALAAAGPVGSFRG